MFFGCLSGLFRCRGSAAFRCLSDSRGTAGRRHTAGRGGGTRDDVTEGQGGGTGTGRTARRPSGGMMSAGRFGCSGTWLFDVGRSSLGVRQAAFLTERIFRCHRSVLSPSNLLEGFYAGLKGCNTAWTRDGPQSLNLEARAIRPLPVCLSIYLPVTMNKCTYTYKCMYNVYVYIGMNVSINMYTYMHKGVCIYIYICIHTCVSVCICV